MFSCLIGNLEESEPIPNTKTHTYTLVFQARDQKLPSLGLNSTGLRGLQICALVSFYGQHWTSESTEAAACETSKETHHWVKADSTLQLCFSTKFAPHWYCLRDLIKAFCSTLHRQVIASVPMCAGDIFDMRYFKQQRNSVRSLCKPLQTPLALRHVNEVKDLIKIPWEGALQIGLLCAHGRALHFSYIRT